MTFSRRGFLGRAAAAAFLPDIHTMPIADGVITSAQIAANSITCGKIAVGCINASSILVNNIVTTGLIR